MVSKSNNNNYYYYNNHVPGAAGGGAVVSRGLQGLPWPPVDDGTDNMYVYIYIYIVPSLKYDIGTKILMLKCFDHKTTFPDTHRHFRQTIQISRTVPIVLRGSRTKIQLTKS